MIWKGGDIVELEEGEPVFRSCWECNSAHEYLKNRSSLHKCFSCGRWWVLGSFIECKTDEEFISLMTKIGLKPGDSTRGGRRKRKAP